MAALASLAALAGCHVGERRGVPGGAQEVVERVTEDVAAGRDDKIYEEAAEEWRATVGPAENRKVLGRVRERLGRVESRTLYSGQQRPGAGGAGAGQAIELVYQTSFERGTAMEKFTLLERDGRWLLARYAVSSEALK